MHGREKHTGGGNKAAKEHDHEAGHLRAHGHTASGSYLTKTVGGVTSFWSVEIKGPEAFVEWGETGAGKKRFSDIRQFVDALAAERWAANEVANRLSHKHGFVVATPPEPMLRTEGVKHT